MSEPQTGTLLEERYRRLLRVLPADYRATWAEEMVGTFLETVHTDDPEQAEYLADYGRPSWSEVSSVLTLAAELRFAAVLNRVSGTQARRAVWGDAIRLVALIGLLGHAIGATITLVALLWRGGLLTWLPTAPAQTAYLVPFGWWQTLAMVTSLLWLPAYLALLFGRRPLSRQLAILALLAVVVTNVALFEPDGPFPSTEIASFAFVALPVLALAAFHRDAPPLRHRPWLVALPAGVAVEAVLLYAVLPADPATYPVLDLPALYCLALVCAALVHLARRGRDTVAWSLALGLLAIAVLGLRLVTLPESFWAAPAGQRSTLLTLGAVECGAVLAVAVPLAMLGLRGLRRAVDAAVAPGAEAQPGADGTR